MGAGLRPLALRGDRSARTARAFAGVSGVGVGGARKAGWSLRLPLRPALVERIL
jgi:hypothetical protein